MKKIGWLIVIAFIATTAVAADLPKWIEGSWRMQAEGTRVDELWTSADGGIMIGMSKTVPPKGKVTFEFLRIAEVDGKLAYLAMPQARPATVFPLKSATDSRVVFENLKHNFPQRVIYWRDGEKLCARIEGTMNGKPQGEEWCYARVGVR